MSEIGWYVVPRYAQPYHVGPRSEKNYTRESANEVWWTDRQTGRHGVLIELLVAVKKIRKDTDCIHYQVKKIQRNRINEGSFEKYAYNPKQGNSEEFDSCDRPSNYTQIRLKSSFFQPVWPWNYAQFGAKSAFFVSYDLEIWRVTLKNNRATFLYYFKLCTSFHSHQWIQSRVTVRKRPILIKIEYFFSRVILKFDGWH